MKRFSLDAPEQGFGFNDLVFGALTAAVTGLAGILSLSLFIQG